MFGLIKKKSENEKLQLAFKSTLGGSHQFLQSNRKEAGAKLAEAEGIIKKTEKLGH